MYDVIIIGSGPAGLAAAIYAQRACMDMLVLEKNYMSGGQVLDTYEVDNYPGLKGMNGFDLGMKLREHADALGAQFVTAAVREVRVKEGRVEGDVQAAETAAGAAEAKTTGAKAAEAKTAEARTAEAKAAGTETAEAGFCIVTDKETYEARTVIIAAGAQHRKLGIPGEEALAGRGVSYCATCDGAFFRDKTVAVIGGGDVAVEDAIFLARGCRKVYVVHRRDELRAVKSLQEKLLSLPNVEMVWDSVALDIRGEQAVEGLAVKNVKTQETQVLPVDGVFVAVGIQPNSQAYQGLVKMDPAGYICADETGRTSVPGLFAAGDIRTKALRQILTAAADGANAVFAAEQFLNAQK